MIIRAWIQRRESNQLARSLSESPSLMIIRENTIDDQWCESTTSRGCLWIVWMRFQGALWSNAEIFSIIIMIIIILAGTIHWCLSNHWGELFAIERVFINHRRKNSKNIIIPLNWPIKCQQRTWIHPSITHNMMIDQFQFGLSCRSWWRCSSWWVEPKTWHATTPTLHASIHLLGIMHEDQPFYPS